MTSGLLLFKVLDFLLLKGRLTYSFTNIFITGVQFGFAADVLIAIGGTKGEIYERKMYRAGELCTSNYKDIK